MRLLVVLALVCIALPVYGGPIVSIPGMFSTGDTEAVGTTDPDYKVCQGAACTPVSAANVVDPSAYSIPWAANGVTSKWVSAVTQAELATMPTNPGADVLYIYRIAVDLTGFYPSTVNIQGTWGADNYGAIYVNGGITSNVLSANSGGLVTATNWNPLSAFSLTGSSGGGFTSGVNNIDFYVYNWAVPNYSGWNPTGLRVQLDTAQAELIPEPGTWALFGGGLLAIGLWRRRRA